MTLVLVGLQSFLITMLPNFHYFVVWRISTVVLDLLKRVLPIKCESYISAMLTLNDSATSFLDRSDSFPRSFLYSFNGNNCIDQFFFNCRLGSHYSMILFFFSFPWKWCIRSLCLSDIPLMASSKKWHRNNLLQSNKLVSFFFCHFCIHSNAVIV